MLKICAMSMTLALCLCSKASASDYLVNYFSDEQKDADQTHIERWDEDSGMMISGDAGLSKGVCRVGWKCMLIPNFEFAVPVKCKVSVLNETWEYDDSKFKTVKILNKREKHEQAKKYLISLSDRQGVPRGLLIYSSAKGVEFFKIYSRHVTFYLSDGQGAAANGCVQKTKGPE